MRNKIIIVLLIISVVIIATVIYFVIGRDGNKDVKSDTTITLTPEVIARLQHYSYFMQTPMYDFKEITELEPEFPKLLIDTFFKQIVKFETNEKFYTNEKLVYVSGDNHYVVRGVLQIKLKDGSFTEQDVEYEYRHSDMEVKPVLLYYVGKRFLSQRKMMRGEMS